MATIDKTDWLERSNRLSDAIDGRLARLTIRRPEAEAPEAEAQVAADGLILRGVTYDPHDDAFEIQMGDALDHVIAAPRTFEVEEADGEPQSVDIVDGEGRQHRVELLGPAPA